MQTIEMNIITALVNDMKAAGYEVAAVWDEGAYIMAKTETATCSVVGAGVAEEIVRPLTLRETLEAIGSVDCSTLHFTHQGKRTWGNRGVFLVLGNGPDVISDHHVPRGEEKFQEIIDGVIGRIESIEGGLATRSSGKKPLISEVNVDDVAVVLAKEIGGDREKFLFAMSKDNQGEQLRTYHLVDTEWVDKFVEGNWDLLRRSLAFEADTLGKSSISQLLSECGYLDMTTAEVESALIDRSGAQWQEVSRGIATWVMNGVADALENETASIDVVCEAMGWEPPGAVVSDERSAGVSR